MKNGLKKLHCIKLNRANREILYECGVVVVAPSTASPSSSSCQPQFEASGRARVREQTRTLYIPIRMCDGRTFARTLTQNRHRAQLNAHAQYNVNMCVCGVDFFFLIMSSHTIWLSHTNASAITEENCANLLRQYVRPIPSGFRD